MAQNSHDNRRNRAEHLAKFKFKPGQSGNPSGRPKKIFTESYERAVTRLIPNDPEGRRIIDAIADSLIKQALKGNVAAVRELADRVEGKVPQGIVGREGGTIQFVSFTPEENELRINELLANMPTGQ